MLDLVGGWVILALKLAGLLYLLELFVVRGFMFIKGYLHYKLQGIPFITPVLPFVGNFLKVVQVIKETPKRDYVPFGPMLND